MYLATGCAGFIGSYYGKSAASSWSLVVGYDNFSHRPKRVLAQRLECAISP